MPTRTEDVPAELVVDFDIADPALAVPHETLAAYQEKTPVAWSPRHGGHWILTCYDDCYEACRDWEVFSVENAQVPRITTEPSIPNEIDPPAHKHYRDVLNPLFSPRRMKALVDRIRAVAVELIDAFAARGTCEFVTEFAQPITAGTFVALMGWPAEHAPQFDRWTTDMLVGKPGASPEEDARVRSEANDAVFAYFGDMIARRNDPRPDDVMSVLFTARYDDERPLTDTELQKMLWLLMVGGLHTVRGVLSFGMLHFLRDRAQRDALIADPGLAGAAAEELLRIDSPVALGRLVKKRTVVRGVTLEPGDRVLLMSSAAGRDPAEFEDPDTLRLDRPTNRHLAFGAGIHRCVGSHLARIEIRTALEEIHRRMPDYELDGDPVFHHSQVRGLEALPLRFTPTA
ncbi:cytochrome P450 [Pseudonocardia sp. RS11V-5]|uniref:cytochrome P450 n=1 Tax=Pseudonocardia terrae TaxID=2905831 RepID=UPI001E51CD47|nr:cytochrome P450 [Pseudonocardia terrae]MCE3550855.1 cytochrome P450 [Pseudonocardia terrae]